MVLELFQLIYEPPVPIEIDYHLPLLARGPAPSPIVPSAMHKLSSSLSEIKAEHDANPYRKYLSAVYRHFNLLSPHLPTLEVAVPEITLDVISREGAAVESFISMLLVREATHLSNMKETSYMLA